MISRTLIAATLLLGRALAIHTPSAIVIIEASHGGAGQDLTNTTVKIPFTFTYSNNSALAAVSTLYLVGATGDTPLDTITCTPFKNADGTGNSGLAFNSTTPSYLSTNTVQVGSIVCISTDISMAPPGGPPGGPSSLAVSLSSSIFATSSKTHHHHTSSTEVATTHSSKATHTKAAKSSATSASSASSSAPVAQSTGNAASSLSLPGEFFGGLALAGFGLAFVL